MTKRETASEAVRSHGRRVLLTVGATFGGIALAAGAAYALWSDGAPITGGAVIAGDLRLTAGVPTWQQITTGVENPAGGTLTTTPTEFYSMPGDVIEITEPVTTYLKGDNLVGVLAVDYADQDASDDVSATFHIEDATGNQVAPANGEAQFGDALSVPGLVGDDDGASANWHVVITVRVLGDYTWTDQPAGSNPGQWAAGNITVALKQVRGGTGFSGAGG